MNTSPTGRSRTCAECGTVHFGASCLVCDLGMTAHDLGDGSEFFTGKLPDSLVLTTDTFAELWSLHPDEYHEIHLHGRRVKTPRWQQAYGADYHYTGQTNKALPVPSILRPLHTWCQAKILPSLNGILLNWYDAKAKHYIGAHRDSTTNMLAESVIVTVSFGESRKFRLRPWKGKTRADMPEGLPRFLDFPTTHGSIFVTPYWTNSQWTHEVPHSAQCSDRRISVTIRAFTEEA